MKKSKNIVLIVTPVLSAALLNACGGSSSQPHSLVNTTTPATTPNQVTTAPAQTAQTRDVYNNLDECVKDWLDKELCEQMSDDDDRDYRTRYKTTRTGRYFYGPRYSSSDRIIVYKGKTITPTGKVTTKMPTFTSSVPSKTTTGSTTTSTTRSSTLPSSSSTSTTTKSTTSSTSPTSTTSSSSTTNPYSSSSSSSTKPYSSSSSSSSSTSSTYSPYSSSSTTRGGFGSTSSSSSSRSSSSS